MFSWPLDHDLANQSSMSARRCRGKVLRVMVRSDPVVLLTEVNKPLVFSRFEKPLFIPGLVGPMLSR